MAKPAASSRRRPPLLLVALGLALTYAELAIESRSLAEISTAGHATSGEPLGIAALSSGVFDLLARYLIAP